MQETGRAGRDGQAARCVLLYSEDDLETQFYLKSAARVTARDVRFVFEALRSRARRASKNTPPGADGRTELWVVPEDLFAEEQLDVELDWDRDELATKLKLVLHHLEADGVLERRENRTRVFGIFPALASLDLAEQALPKAASPVTRRVLRYLYDPDRPRRISVLDVADEAQVLPAVAFRELSALGRLGVIKHDLGFEVTLARGVSPSSREIAAQRFAVLEALFALGEDLDDAPILHVRSAAIGVGRAVARSVAPYELFQGLRALRRQGLIRLDKVGPGRFRVRFDTTAAAALDELRSQRRTAEALLEYAERAVGERRGRDVRFELDVERFLRESPDLFERWSADGVVSACLLLHHLDAWHIADPPVVLEAAMRVAVDPKARLSSIDAERPRLQFEHDVTLVHLLRRYALLPAEQRAGYVDDYFSLDREAFLSRHLADRRAELVRPVSPEVEQNLFEGLTPAQRDAVTAEDRALLVVAGPGSGKTHTLVRRVAHLVRARQVRPEEILVLAFNRAAAAEIRERLEQPLGGRAACVDVRTFHSFALRLTGTDLRDDAVDAELALAEALPRAADLLSAPPAQPASKAGEPPGTGAAPPPDRAELEEHRLRVLGPVRHVLVDEYQDLDADQYRLLTALVGLDRSAQSTERSVFVVGDDDQAIYGFRDASIEFLRRFEREFGARRVCLVENFRSSVPIVEAAAGFVARIPDRMKAKPEEQVRPAPGSDPGSETSVRRFRYRSDEQCSAHVAFAIRKSLEARAAQSIAVLARHWSALDDVRCLLEEQGIAVVVHHRDFHRPVHRRQPAFRMMRKLWDMRERISGAAADQVRALLETSKRSLDEPPARELIAYAEAVDRDRRLPSSRDDSVAHWSPMTGAELADELLLASRDAALRDHASGASQGQVHLCTFHGAKGLEFDKVFVLPSSLPSGAAQAAEERRTYYVAMTRARREIVLATVGRQRELALDVAAPELDLDAAASRLPRARAGYLDCDPGDVVLTSTELARSQGIISLLREGDPLDVEPSAGGARVSPLRLTHQGKLVAVLSRAGQDNLEALYRRTQSDALRARVHEVYAHVVRNAQGEVVRRWLVVLPSLRVGRRVSA